MDVGHPKVTARLPGSPILVVPVGVRVLTCRDPLPLSPIPVPKHCSVHSWSFDNCPNKFTDRDLLGLVGQLLGKAFSAGQGTYDQHRLGAYGLIIRQPPSPRYRVTDPGLHHALLLARAHDHLLPTVARIAAAERGPPQTTNCTYLKAIDRLAEESGLTA